MHSLQTLSNELNEKKNILVSMNLVSSDVLSDCTSSEATAAKNRLEEINQRYDTVCARSSRWNKNLQQALAGCSDLQQTLAGLQSWLASIGAQLQEIVPLNLMASDSQLRDVYDKLKVSCLPTEFMVQIKS